MNRKRINIPMFLLEGSLCVLRRAHKKNGVKAMNRLLVGISHRVKTTNLGAREKMKANMNTKRSLFNISLPSRTAPSNPIIPSNMQVNNAVPSIVISPSWEKPDIRKGPPLG
jgi:hypothetical protein